MGLSLWIRPSSRYFPRGTSALKGLALVSYSLLLVAQDGFASSLRSAVEEAKKPVEKQEILWRDSENSNTGSTSLAILSMMLDFLCDSSEYAESRTSMQSQSAPPLSVSAPSEPRGDPSCYTAFKSLHVQPSDNVLKSLDGAGIELGGASPSGVHVGVSIEWLRGEIREDSPAYGGLVNPYEIALDVRARFPFIRWGFFGMNGFGGIRGAALGWKYANPVFAIDEFGDGEEIGRDWLPSLSVYVGLGLTPLHTRYLDIGVDLGTGLRGYFPETVKKFHNDVLKDGSFTQFSVEVALHF